VSRNEGSSVLLDYDLRITERCASQDLRLPVESLGQPVRDFPAGSGPVAELIDAFIEKRSQSPAGESTMERLATGRIPISILRRGNRLRALTWHDREHRVVWLVAAHLLHRSGEKADSYSYFRSLGIEDLLPSETDYQRLLGERAIAEADALFDGVPRLMREAAENRNREISGSVGRVPISMVMTDDVPPLLHLAVSARWTDDGPDPPANWLLALLFRCYRHSFENWSLPFDTNFPVRKLRDDEQGFCDFVADWPHEGI
jgi:hypothetical protein